MGRSQWRTAAPGRMDSHSAHRGIHPRKPWGPALAGHENGERQLPYPWVKNTTTPAMEKGKGRPFSWREHRLWCEKMWEEGPKKETLRRVAQKVCKVHMQWTQTNPRERIPNFVEGREPQVVAEIYCMHHLPSSKGYVGMAYHGSLDRMKTHWNGRNREKDPSSTMMRNSASPYDWVCWPVERCQGRRLGHVLYHKRFALREGWWATHLNTWWPRGFNAAGTGGEHKGGSRNDWWRYRETYRKEWADNTETRLREACGAVQELSKKLEDGEEQGWEDLAKLPPEDKRRMLQALNMDRQLGGKNRQQIERLIREDLKQHKALKKKPKGDFVKLLITHTGWNAAEVRSIIREPSVCKAHPNPTDAERIWVCERNVPPTGSWLLNYTAMEDEDLDANKRHALEAWDKQAGGETSDVT